MIKQIKFLKLKGNIFLAPMSGITNIAFRMLCRKYGASLCFTEFVNSNAILNAPQLKKLDFYSEDRPLAIQIFGNNIDSLVNSAIKIQKNCDIIDLNFGCPSHKITKIGAGSELLKDPNKVHTIVSSIVDSIKKPVSVKIRSGINFKNVNAVEIAKACEDAGAKMITIHARTQEQGYSGKVDLNIIRKVKESVSICVIGNGDIRDHKSASEMFEFTGCDGIMIGRAAMKNPAIFSEILNKDSKKDKIILAKEYYELVKKYNLDFIELKIGVLNIVSGFNGAIQLRKKISSTKTFEDIERILW